MSTPEQPDLPSLTRKQMREIRNTGATPIVSAAAPTIVDTAPPIAPDTSQGKTEDAATAADAKPSAAAGDASAAQGAPSDSQADAEKAAAEQPRPIAAAPLPRAALPAALGSPPAADASVDLGVAPLTRRQARQQERIRTASVPVITPDVAAAHAAGAAETVATADVVLEERGDTGARTTSSDESIDAHPREKNSDDIGELFEQRVDASADTGRRDDHDSSGDGAASEPVREEDRPIVSAQLGADLLEAESIQAALPPSFDQLISRTVTGSVGTANALILSQTPSAPPLVGPVAATGEVLVTGTFNLPEGLGSTGHANGTADGKDVDAVLIDGELPAHSSPTPIAASAAISTVKTPGDVISPPTPEKGGRLMLTLAITAGVLALALVGVLILAFVTGVF